VLINDIHTQQPASHIIESQQKRQSVVTNRPTQRKSKQLVYIDVHIDVLLRIYSLMFNTDILLPYSLKSA